MKEAFIEWKPRGASVALLGNVIRVIETYAQQGYRLTVRQLYYQMVSRDIIANTERQYKRLVSLVTNARMAGDIDWDDIVDRGRTPVMPPQWGSPAEIIHDAARQYRLDRWKGQPYAVEVWCEKDALSSVLEPVSSRYHVRYMANHGYSSSTAMYDAAQRVTAAHANDDKEMVVIYLGDHDPSGMDMTRDIKDRLKLMSDDLPLSVIRLALTYEQVEQYQPPPNPTKLEDSRAMDYIEQYGMSSWELDALEPQVLDAMVSEEIEKYLDRAAYDLAVEREERHRTRIQDAAQAMDENEEEDGEDV